MRNKLESFSLWHREDVGHLPEIEGVPELVDTSDRPYAGIPEKSTNVFGVFGQ